MIADRIIATEMLRSSRPGSRGEVVELRERDQSDRAAADAVEERHHLRHRRHLHAAGADRTHDGADRHRNRDPHVALQAGLGERDDDRQQHPAAPSWLPSRARRGLERNRNARMKVTIVTR